MSSTPEGFWYRNLNRYDLPNLNARLKMKSWSSVNVPFHEKYPLSSFHYLNGTIATQQRLSPILSGDKVGEGGLGIILAPDATKRFFWRTGPRAVSSDEIEVEADLLKYGFEVKTTKDSHPDTLLQQLVDANGTDLPWTEGKFRYLPYQILGLVVGLKNLEGTYTLNDAALKQMAELTSLAMKTLPTFCLELQTGKLELVKL